jgi:hypothetical protein
LTAETPRCRLRRGPSGGVELPPVPSRPGRAPLSGPLRVNNLRPRCPPHRLEGTAEGGNHLPGETQAGQGPIIPAQAQLLQGQRQSGHVCQGPEGQDKVGHRHEGRPSPDTQVHQVKRFREMAGPQEVEQDDLQFTHVRREVVGQVELQDILPLEVSEATGLRVADKKVRETAKHAGVFRPGNDLAYGPGVPARVGQLAEQDGALGRLNPGGEKQLPPWREETFQGSHESPDIGLGSGHGSVLPPSLSRPVPGSPAALSRPGWSPCGGPLLRVRREV